LNYITLQAFK